MSELLTAPTDLVSVRIPLQIDGTRSFGEPTDADLDLINSRAPSPLRREQVFVYSSEISNQRLDSFWTRMAGSTLANYAADAQAGVPVMNSHRAPGLFSDGELPIGRSIAADYLTGAEPRVVATGYMLRDLYPNGQGQPGTNDLIRMIEGGVLTDVSVGFALAKTGWYRCGICDRNQLRDAECRHMPGVEYQAADGTMQRAFAWIEDAHLKEYSHVYKGSTPQAIVLKGERLYRSGDLSRAQVAEFEDHTGTRMFQRFAGVSLPDTHDTAPERAKTEAAMDPKDFARLAGLDGVETLEQLQERVLALKADATRATLAEKRLGELEAEQAELSRKLAEAERFAQDGRQYRADLIEAALAAGVRAQGDSFDREAFTEIFAQDGTTVRMVRALKEQWERQAESQFGPGATTPPSLRTSDPRQLRPAETAAGAGSEGSRIAAAQPAVSNEAFKASPRRR